ncbi:MAG: aldo/keto reductase [Verrucomicrobiota bacterium]
MQRRDFLKVVGSVAGGMAVGAPPAFSKASDLENFPHPSGTPRRVLGRTGFKISIVGFSGFALQHAELDAAQCKKIVHQAFAGGVNYYDVAPAYGKDGLCEVRLGEALQGLDRQQYYLACKTKQREKDGCRQELERSLTRLKTDHFDVYQLHHLRQTEDVEKALGPGGAVEMLVKAKAEGKIRAIGFSAHTTRAAVAALKGFKFDTVMFPINFVEYFNIGFGKEVLELAKKEGAAVLAIKPLSQGGWAKDAERKRKWWYRTMEEMEDIALAYRFSLSQPGVVAGFPPAWPDLQAKAIEAIRNYRPISDDEVKKLQEWATKCSSLFKRDEEAVALNQSHPEAYPENPESCYPCEWV